MRCASQDAQRRMCSRVAGPFACAMGIKSGVHIYRNAGVNAAVGAFNQINKPIPAGKHDASGKQGMHPDKQCLFLG